MGLHRKTETDKWKSDLGRGDQTENLSIEVRSLCESLSSNDSVCFKEDKFGNN
jgi:hypothetical protein